MGFGRSSPPPPPSPLPFPFHCSLSQIKNSVYPLLINMSVLFHSSWSTHHRHSAGMTVANQPFPVLPLKPRDVIAARLTSHTAHLTILNPMRTAA